MKLYQGTQSTVNGSIAIVDAEAITARASEGLLALSMNIGLEVVRQDTIKLGSLTAEMVLDRIARPQVLSVQKIHSDIEYGNSVRPL